VRQDCFGDALLRGELDGGWVGDVQAEFFALVLNQAVEVAGDAFIAGQARDGTARFRSRL